MRLGARRVTAPDGTRWKVGRRWLPDRPRLRRERDAGDSGEGLGSAFEGGLDDALAIIGILIAAVLLVTLVLFPLLVLAAELVGLLLVTVAGLANRAIGRRPWLVRARSDGGHERVYEVAGFRASGARRDQIAQQLESTGRLNP